MDDLSKVETAEVILRHHQNYRHSGTSAIRTPRLHLACMHVWFRLSLTMTEFHSTPRRSDHPKTYYWRKEQEQMQSQGEKWESDGVLSPNVAEPEWWSDKGDRQMKMDEEMSRVQYNSNVFHVQLDVMTRTFYWLSIFIMLRAMDDRRCRCRRDIEEGRRGSFICLKSSRIHFHKFFFSYFTSGQHFTFFFY